MDVNDILTALSSVLDVGDMLDNSGIGISAMTNGQHTTRELCQMELGSFLLYVGAGGGFFNDGQAGLVNLLLSDKYGQISSWQMKSVADELDMPIAANNATFTAFKNGDDALSQQNGVPSNKFTDLLISLYESFGGLMVAFNENVLSRVRCDTYINGLRARQGSSTVSTSSTAPVTKPSPTKPSVGANVDISPYVPAGVTLTENQKEYLSAIVDLINRYGPVDSSTVAMHMHKSTSAVSSAVNTLMKKGILDKNDDAKIVIAEKKETATKSNATGNKTTVKTKTGTGKVSGVSEKQPAKKTSGSSETGRTDNKDILAPAKYKGIHHVTGKAERISPFGIWSIEVPPTFSYTMDPAYTSKTVVSMMGGYSEGRDHYPLQIQTTKDCNFNEAYEPSFGLTIQEQRVNFIKVLDDWDDLKSAAAKKALAEVKNSIISFKVLKQTKDILVEYNDSNRDDEALTIGFTIFCSGTNYGLLGQIDIHGENRDELEAAAMTMLKSVEKIKYDYSLAHYIPYTLPESWGLNFSKGKTFDLVPDVKVPVPDGFHSTTNPAETGGRSFIIVPEGYAFSRNPMDAKIGISGGVGEINLPETYKAGEIFYWIIGALPPNVLDEHWMTYLVRRTEKCAAFIQENFDSSMEWVLYRILLLAGRNGHIFTMRVNFANSGATFPAARVDVMNIVSHWINHIQVSGEKPPTAVKPKSTTTPKEMSVYSTAYQKAMKARLLPGEKNLPPEVYCKEIDFRAGDIAENGIKFNLLKDNGPIIEEHKYMTGKIKGAYLEIPEGVTEIGNYAFSHSEFQIVKLPRSLRILKQGVFSDCKNLRKVIFQEGVRELKAVICGECPNVTELHLPSTVEIIDDDAFKWETLSRRSDITVYMTGTSAKKVYTNAKREELDLPGAKNFIIDGKSYTDLEDYVKTSERERQAAAERQRQEMLKRDEEARKNTQRNSLRQRINQLEQERDSLKGLFAGMKRNKIQREIDELNTQLRKI